MLRAGYKGRLYPINPNRTEIQGLKAYADIASLPEAPDLAIVAVAGKGALDGVKACAARGVKIAVVVTSGFGEIDEEGKAAQAEMVRIAHALRRWMVGLYGIACCPPTPPTRYTPKNSPETRRHDHQTKTRQGQTQTR